MDPTAAAKVKAAEKTGLWGKHTEPDGVIDTAAWNSESEARNI